MLSKEQRIGLFFLVGLVLLGLAVELTVGFGVLHRSYPLYATFHDVQGLDLGADVRLAGIKVGRVAGIDIVGEQVRVTMALRDGVVVRQDAGARLDFRALSGERFVALSLGSASAPVAATGATIVGETPAGFGDVTTQLSAAARSIDELAGTLNEGAGRLLTTLADVLEENRSALTETAQRIASIADKLDHGAGTLGRLVNDPTLYERVSATLGDVGQSAAELGAVAQQVREGRGTIGKLLTEDDGLYGQLRDTVDTLETTAAQAREITSGIQAGQGTLGKLVQDDTLYEQSLDTLRTANRAVQSVEDQAPISLLGAIVTSLF